MTTALTTWDPNSGAALPAHIADALGGFGSNIPDRQTVPSLSYEGKTWAIVKDGNRTKLQAKNSDGDMIPIPIMRAVVLNFNSDRGRSYYEGTYNPAQSAAPKCWSPDGKTPDTSVKEKVAASCTGCPMSVKGSRVADGREMAACSQHRMIAVAPAFDITTDPLRLKIAVTSDYDKEIVEHGWFAFRQYVDFLKSRGITHTALVVTKIKFDPNVAYPKLFFALDRVLSVEEVAQVKTALANPKVAELLAEKWSAAGVNGTPTDDGDIRPHGLEGAYADGWQPHPDSAGWSYKGQEVVQNEDLEARYPAPVAAPAAPSTPPAIPASQQVVDVVPTAPPPVPLHNALENAAANGWIKHPDAEGYWYLGQEVITEAELEDRFPPPAAATGGAPSGTSSVPVAPSAPSASPSEPAPVHDPIAAAVMDGWVKHPDAPGFHYRGQEVVADGDLAAKYPTSAGAPEPASAPAGSAPTAAPTASPSDAAIPSDVQGLLDKWTS